MLRASGLARIEPRGKHAVLTLNEQMMTLWQKLNAAERYVALLEAWLINGSDEILGERDTQASLANCRAIWQELAKKSTMKFGLKRNDNNLLNYYPGLHNLALMELFGFVRVTVSKPAPGQGWNVIKIEALPFGVAIFQLLETKFIPQLYIGLWDDSGENLTSLFSTLQPLIPSLNNELLLPPPPKREGIFTFKISLEKDIWRRISIPSSLTLDHLSDEILDSVDFDNDHLYQFTYRNEMGRKVEVGHPSCDTLLFTDEVFLSDLPLQVGECMEYVFDFGDWWKFNVQLESFDPVKSRRKKPILLESHGKAPEQYPGWNDDDDDESDWDDDDFDE